MVKYSVLLPKIMDLELRLTCVCGNSLSINKTIKLRRKGVLKIEIAPCKKCLGRAEIRGWGDGYREGKNP